VHEQPGRRRKRFRNPTASDPKGSRIIDAAITLVRDGTPFHELRLADAVDRAAADESDLQLTRGAAYARFPGGQREFRMTVLSTLLRQQHAVHRREGGTSAKEELARTMGREKPISPEKLRDFIETTGRQQMQTVAGDATFTLRLYALGLITRDDFPAREAVLDELRSVERESDDIWAGLLRALVDEYGLAMRREFEEGDFEVFLGALLTGLALRRLTARDDEVEHLDRLYGRLVAATGLSGFFVTGMDEDQGLWTAFADRLRGALAFLRDHLRGSASVAKQ
jgi:hypothetical protein